MTAPVLITAAIDGLHELMAYKDEYEVARLHLDSAFSDYVAAEVPAASRLRWHLHPPVLRALGLRHKIRMGRTAPPMFRLLRAMRRVRGTWADPFGRARVRRVERELVRDYIAVLDDIVASLTRSNHEVAVQLGKLPDVVRGYERVNLANVETYRARVAELRASLVASPAESEQST